VKLKNEVQKEIWQREGGVGGRSGIGYVYASTVANRCSTRKTPAGLMAIGHRERRLFPRTKEVNAQNIRGLQRRSEQREMSQGVQGELTVSNVT
jgi:hypothetical protein